MPKKKAETRPSNPPVAVRFTPGQIEEINEVANAFQMSKQDVIRLSVAAGLKAMRRIGISGLQGFIADEITTDASTENIIQIPKKKANIMAAAGPGIMAEVIDWEGDDDTVSVKICGNSNFPLFNDGDVIDMTHKRASRSPFMKKGLIYLVQLDGEWMVKRYDTRKAKPEEKGAEYLTSHGTVGILKSENPEFDDIDIAGDCEWAAWFE